MEIFKIIAITLLCAIAAGGVLGLVLGKHMVNRTKKRPLLSKKERIAYSASVVVGVGLILFAALYTPKAPGMPGEDGMIGLPEGEMGMVDGMGGAEGDPAALDGAEYDSGSADVAEEETQEEELSPPAETAEAQPEMNIAVAAVEANPAT